jgi:hypothetical protein
VIGLRDIHRPAEDLEIAPDFFDYFEALLPLAESDPTIYCISAWNDNGQAKFVRDPSKNLAIFLFVNVRLSFTDLAFTFPQVFFFYHCV